MCARQRVHTDQSLIKTLSAEFPIFPGVVITNFWGGIKCVLCDFIKKRSLGASPDLPWTLPRLPFPLAYFDLCPFAVVNYSC